GCSACPTTTTPSTRRWTSQWTIVFEPTLLPVNASTGKRGVAFMNKARRPPGPKGRFLLGHLLEMAGDRQEFYSLCARAYGDCTLRWHGWLPVWLLNHPDLVRQVLVTEAHNFQKDWRYRVASRLLGNGLITSSGELWLRQRRLMQPAFLSRQVAAYGEDMVTLVRAATDSWVDGEVRDVHADMVRLTMAILVKTIFGMD